MAPISITSRDKGNPAGKESKDERDKDSPESNQNLLPDEGVWNNGNWNSSDEPGNLPGNPPGQPADDGAGNGNFQLSAPVVSLPGRGIDLALNLNYNSRLWNKSGSELTYDIDRGFPAPGWSLGFGKIMDMGANGGSMITTRMVRDTATREVSIQATEANLGFRVIQPMANLSTITVGGTHPGFIRRGRGFRTECIFTTERKPTMPFIRHIFVTRTVMYF